MRDYPKHTEPEPLVPGRIGAPVVPDAVRLFVAPLPRTERCGSHYYFRLALEVGAIEGPAQLDRENPAARAIGDVRSANILLTGAEADAIERAWWRPTDWPPPEGSLECSRSLVGARWLEERAGEGAESSRAIVNRALDDLRARAAAAGVGEIGDVRCYVVADTLNPTPERLWCEGVARAPEP